MSEPTFTEEQEQALLDTAADPDSTTTVGSQSRTTRPAADVLLLLDRASYQRQRREGRSRFRYYRLTGGYRSN